MIEKSEVLKMAAGLDLNPDTVEKDYILGWMLFGIKLRGRKKIFDFLRDRWEENRRFSVTGDMKIFFEFFQ